MVLKWCSVSERRNEKIVNTGVYCTIFCEYPLSQTYQHMLYVTNSTLYIVAEDERNN